MAPGENEFDTPAVGQIPSTKSLGLRACVGISHFDRYSQMHSQRLCQFILPFPSGRF